jgi:Ser/Thr protein kinase RdoA (MazF antagonist)
MSLNNVIDDKIESPGDLLGEISNMFNLGRVFDFKRLDGGIVNSSYDVKTNRGRFIFQSLSPIFTKEVIHDYQEVQSYLRTNELHVPVLLRGNDFKPYVSVLDNLWRVFEYIHHDPVKIFTPQLAFETGRTVGKFHEIMSHSDFRPKFHLDGFHDTRAIVEKLDKIMTEYECDDESKRMGDFVRNNIKDHLLATALPKTLIHGDPKVDNFLFRDGKVISLLDLDTMMFSSELVDLGDGLRSWCRLRYNDKQRFSQQIFSEALRGYRSEHNIPYDDYDIISATKSITLELVARFLIDSFEQSYFSFNSKKYPSLAVQNRDRCKRYSDYYKEIDIKK